MTGDIVGETETMRFGRIFPDWLGNRSERGFPRLGGTGVWCGLLTAIVLLLCPAGRVWSQSTARRDTSVWRELAVPGPVSAPIKHQPYWRGERELLGYRPRFYPNAVTFDQQNRPHIRTKKGIQTLNGANRWVEIPFVDSVVSDLPHWEKRIFRSGYFPDQRVVFDRDGDAYVVLRALGGGKDFGVLLHSRDGGRNWMSYRLPTVRARLEFQDGNNPLKYPPPILCLGDQKLQTENLQLVVPRKNPDGTLTIPQGIKITDISKLTSNHSGAGNSVISLGEKIHVVFPASKGPPKLKGTPQCIVTFDRRTGRLTKPILLGMGMGDGDAPDSHNIPAISADNKGYLHVILSAHNQPFQYTHSLKPNSTTDGWTVPKNIGYVKKGKNVLYQYSYVALICDKKNTLHLVGRLRDENARATLTYMRKKEGQGWEKPRSLVVPFHTGYSGYYHRLNIDRKGRLFLSYSYIGNYLSLEAIAAYRSKWPREKVPPWKKQSQYQKGDFLHYYTKPHDPAMLMSDDGGDTWRLALTDDFTSALLQPNSEK